MEFSKRIQGITDRIAFPIIADIGTDHGYIPVLALTQGKAVRAIACDINKGPLSKAQENVLKYGLADKISLRLADGFSAIMPGEAEVGIAAGMGGPLIMEIMERSPETVDSFRQLILQPQSHLPQVRKKLHAIGFSIFDESICLDQGKYYFIIDARPGGEPPYLPKEYLLGKKLAEKKDPVYLSYLSQQIRKTQIIIENIYGQGKGLSLNTKAEVEAHQEMLRLYEEALND